MKIISNDYINYRIAKSQEVFEDALLLAQKDRWNSCVNRLYYSSYYLASALLLKNNIEANTHSGVKTQLFLHFVKTGAIIKDFGKLYSNMFNWRQEADCADFIEFDEQTVRPLLQKVDELNKLIKTLLRTS